MVNVLRKQKMIIGRQLSLLFFAVAAASLVIITITIAAVQTEASPLLSSNATAANNTMTGPAVKNATIEQILFDNGTGLIRYGDGTVRNFTHNYLPPEYEYCNNSLYPAQFMKQMNMTLPDDC